MLAASVTKINDRLNAEIPQIQLKAGSLTVRVLGMRKVYELHLVQNYSVRQDVDLKVFILESGRGFV